MNWGRFLEQRNPDATRRSVAIWAAGGAILGAVVGIIGWSNTDMTNWALLFFLPWMAVGCGIAGAAMEWQMGPDE